MARAAWASCVVVAAVADLRKGSVHGALRSRSVHSTASQCLVRVILFPDAKGGFGGLDLYGMKARDKSEQRDLTDNELKVEPKQGEPRDRKKYALC